MSPLSVSPAQFLLVAVGGAAGACLRYAASVAALHLFGPGSPWGTLTVNALGGFLMGVLVGISAGEPRWMLLLLGTGLLGGFTTFSAFSLETVLMLERGAAASAAGYVLASVLLGVGCVWLGLEIGRGVG